MVAVLKKQILLTSIIGNFSRTKMRSKNLKQKGQLIYAKLTEYVSCPINDKSYNSFSKLNSPISQTEFQLKAQWVDPETNEAREFESRKIKTDETTIKYFFKTFRRVPIFLDPQNTDNYYFELPVFVK